MGNANAVYVAKKSAVLTNPTAATTFLQANDSTKAAAVYFPDQWQSAIGSGQAVGSTKFAVRAWGRATGGTTTNFSPVISIGTSITASSNTAWAANTAAAFNSASGNWHTDVHAVWDYTSKKISGYFHGNNGSAGVLMVLTIATQLTSRDCSVSGLGFTVDCLFSATNAGNLAYLDGFELEIL